MLSIVASSIRIAGLTQGADRPVSVPPNVSAYRATLIDFCTGGIERAALER